MQELFKFWKVMLLCNMRNFNPEKVMKVSKGTNAVSVEEGRGNGT
jgi:hypothetical protein